MTNFLCEKTDTFEDAQGEDETDLRRFNTLISQIKDEVKGAAKIEVILFYTALNELIQCKIREQATMPTTKHDMVALAKKLLPNLDREPKPTLLVRSHHPLSGSSRFERTDTLTAYPLREKHSRKDTSYSYCKKSGHKEAAFRKKYSGVKQNKKPKSQASEVQVATVKDFGASQC